MVQCGSHEGRSLFKSLFRERCVISLPLQQPWDPLQCKSKVRLQPMTENSNETRTWTFLPSVWLLNQRSLYQSSLLEAQTSPELHRSLRLFLPNSPFNLFLNGSQTCMVVSKLSEPPFAPILPSQVITLNKFLEFLLHLGLSFLDDFLMLPELILCFQQQLIYFVEIRFVFSMIVVCVHLCMASFTQHDNLRTHRFCWSYQDLIAFLLLSSILSKLLTGNWVVTSWS